MKQFHKPAYENRMVGVVADAGLPELPGCNAEDAMAFMQPLATEFLVAVAIPPVAMADAV